MAASKPPNVFALWGRAMVAIVIIVLLGTAGFYAAERSGSEPLTPLQSLYLTVVTISTVGYGDFAPRTAAGQVLAIILISAGYGMVIYAIALFTDLAMSGELGRILGRTRMERSIAALDEHVIVCGHGRVGEMVCDELERSRVSFVIVERDAEKIPKLTEEGRLHVYGDGTDDEALEAAGIRRARCVIATAGKDADNVYICLTARELNPGAAIVARADNPLADSKLRRAGANRVVSPNQTAAVRIALAATQPAVQDFFDIHTARAAGLRVEEIKLDPSWGLAGQTLAEADFRRRFGIAVILLVRSKTGETHVIPGGTVTLTEDDLLVCLGRREQFDRFLAELVPDADAIPNEPVEDAS